LNTLTLNTQDNAIEKRRCKLQYEFSLRISVNEPSKSRWKGRVSFFGNKKGVDIIVKTQANAIAVVEVKGVNKRNDWMIGNNGKLPTASNLFYAFVCFHGRISELTFTADIWLIPSEKLGELTQHVINRNGKTVYVRYSLINNYYGDYKNTFEVLNEYLEMH